MKKMPDITGPTSDPEDLRWCHPPARNLASSGSDAALLPAAGKERSQGGRTAAAGGAYCVCQQLHTNPLYCRIKSDRES